MRKSLIQAAKFTAFLAIGILLLWLAFRTVDFRGLAEGLKGADYSWLILSSFFGIVAYLSRARRWIILINPLGYNPSFANTFYALMSGYLANLALPRVGEITRCMALGKKEKIPADQLVGTVVVERTIDFISLLVIMMVLFFTSGSSIREYLNESVIFPLRDKIFSVFGSALIPWIIFFVLTGTSLFLIIRYRKQLRKIKLVSKLFDLAKGVINGLKTITNLKRNWEFIFHTIFIWLNYAMMTWVVVFCLESTSHLSFGNSIFILVIGGLAMSAPVQGGVGAFHYFVSRGIAFVEGVNIEDAMAYAILTHESQLVVVLILGAISFYMLYRKNKTKNNDPSGRMNTGT
ncbi:MAG TPA: lysylphosphatidylglycerol synthase transmembrane domain-containing protein [Bacteroidales bacterium]|nr:lysylphosphatidylglycerol synthase transmembrane domain-containing protein [Bacteroidales bacterium]HPJ59218.1 lysylphosphatidylglycerol synthase transmembrane domain-containing protein [Bacteroidales bacterium]HPR11841.1 lysylphosphatidylglycerol synthase transmembrane domain-containing protein [Bacteroidales bacterium]HRW84010.1 lysylphosphatidylglycerol synthase transmembrane domain-containing protein [Bacteroidales bacterium]